MITFLAVLLSVAILLLGYQSGTVIRLQRQVRNLQAKCIDLECKCNDVEYERDVLKEQITQTRLASVPLFPPQYTSRKLRKRLHENGTH